MFAPIVRFASAVAISILAIAGIAVWHHIRVRQFIQSVYDLLCEELPGALGEHAAELRSSILELRFPGESAVYQLRVRHRARMLEIGTEFRGTRGEHERWRDRMVQRLSELKARVSPLLELEETLRTLQAVEPLMRGVRSETGHLSIREPSAMMISPCE